jgi:glutaredoxin 3
MPAISIYTKVYCPYCTFAKSILKRKGVAFEEIDLEAEPLRLPEMVSRSAGARTVPQIFIDDRHVGGSDDLRALDEAGVLDAMLAEPVAA